MKKSDRPMSVLAVERADLAWVRTLTEQISTKGMPVSMAEVMRRLMARLRAQEKSVVSELRRTMLQKKLTDIQGELAKLSEPRAGQARKIASGDGDGDSQDGSD